MKKLILITTLVFALTNALAQVNFGIQLGANFASQKWESDEDNDIKSKTGLVIGALAEIPFGSSINFRPELNFIQKGFKLDETGVELTETLNYIELSPNFVYNVPAGAGNVFFGLGPSFGFAVSGKFKLKVTGEEEESGDIDFGNDEANDDLKGFDFGLNLLAGYKLAQGIFFSAGYNLGLANISLDEDESIKNKGFSVKVGYMFGNKKAASSNK